VEEISAEGVPTEEQHQDVSSWVYGDAAVVLNVSSEMLFSQTFKLS
jgi:hypothetical protein